MDKTTLTSCKVSRGFAYSYHHIQPVNASKAYILFIHGFPSLPTDFHHQILHLSSLGYGILAPTLIGYGDTSRPEESETYRLRGMADDLIEILDRHGIARVIGIGHDWGVTLLSRLEFYHPTRISSMAFLTIGCSPFGQPFNLEMVNKMTKEQLGYEGYGYIEFFTNNSVDAAKIVDEHQESFRSLIYAEDPSLWKQHFGSLGGLRKWLVEDQKAKTLPHFSGEVEKAHEQAFTTSHPGGGDGGYVTTLNWYINHVTNVNVEDEQAELERRGIKGYQTTKPVLQILAAKDVIALPAIQRQMNESYAPHAKMLELNTGHWVMLEAPRGVNEALERFISNQE